MISVTGDPQQIQPTMGTSRHSDWTSTFIRPFQMSTVTTSTLTACHLRHFVACRRPSWQCSPTTSCRRTPKRRTGRGHRCGRGSRSDGTKVRTIFSGVTGSVRAPESCEWTSPNTSVDNTPIRGSSGTSPVSAPEIESRRMVTSAVHYAFKATLTGPQLLSSARQPPECQSGLF